MQRGCCWTRGAEVDQQAMPHAIDAAAVHQHANCWNGHVDADYTASVAGQWRGGLRPEQWTKPGQNAALFAACDEGPPVDAICPTDPSAGQPQSDVLPIRRTSGEGTPLSVAWRNAARPSPVGRQRRRRPRLSVASPDCGTRRPASPPARRPAARRPAARRPAARRRSRRPAARRPRPAAEARPAPALAARRPRPAASCLGHRRGAEDHRRGAAPRVHVVRGSSLKSRGGGAAASRRRRPAAFLTLGNQVFAAANRADQPASAYHCDAARVKLRRRWLRSRTPAR